MNTLIKEKRSNFRLKTGALWKAFLALAILAVLLPLPASGILPLAANQDGKLKGKEPSAPGFIDVSGSFIDCSFNGRGPGRINPKKLIFTGDLTQTFYGTMDGCLENTETDFVYKDGSGTFIGSGTFTGVINGRSGTMVFSYSGIFIAGEPDARAQWTLDKGTGGLANLHGEGTWIGAFIDPVETECTGDPTHCEAMFEGTYFGYLGPVN
jgi:Protein of unknown function (DUF3224)